ncbi:MAG: phosphoribosylaminoimidazolesuccinocarboxamide synthase [Planctomycetota bacterium]
MLDFDRQGALIRTDLPFPVRRGKVRDVYDLGDSLLIVATDRISAFDYILPNGIPGKGRLLTSMSVHWFDLIEQLSIVPHHLMGTTVPDAVRSKVPEADLSGLDGRVMVSRKAKVVPFECVVRGYLEGSGWREYLSTQSVCGVALPAGLKQCSRLEVPIFTPATKAEEGHDENVSFEVMAKALGDSLAAQLRELSLQIYRGAADAAALRGILIADTKFEFGQHEGQVMLIDEVLTPDSSRFWAADEYQPGHSQRSFDKQFVREFLQESDWDRDSPPPPLPDEIVEHTQARYQEGYDRITGE